MSLKSGIIALTDIKEGNYEIEKKLLAEAGYVATPLSCKTEEALIAECQGYQVLLNVFAPLTERVLKELPDLKVIIRYGVGVDNVDIIAAKQLGIQVCNVPDYGTTEVADHAVALTLTMLRKLSLGNQLVHQGKWSHLPTMPLYRLSDLTVGIVGLGRIGSAYAYRMKAFGCKLISLAREGQRSLPQGLEDVEFVSMEELLRRSDVLSLHCPLEGNYDLISAPQLAKMKESAYLINVSRGPLINEEDLYVALKEKQIAGAAVDVSVKEPISPDNPLLTLENFFITPHMAWYSEEADREMKTKVAQEAIRAVKGEPLLNVVNP